MTYDGWPLTDDDEDDDDSMMTIGDPFNAPCFSIILHICSGIYQYLNVKSQWELWLWERTPVSYEVLLMQILCKAEGLLGPCIIARYCEFMLHPWALAFNPQQTFFERSHWINTQYSDDLISQKITCLCFSCIVYTANMALQCLECQKVSRMDMIIS